MYFLKCFMNLIKNSPYVTGIYFGGHERTWCKYILTRYSGLLSRQGDLRVVKSLYIYIATYYLDIST